jgi:hypothetical protein
MAPRPSKKEASKPAAPRADLVDKEPTDLHEGFAEYVQEQTGIDDFTAKHAQLAYVLMGKYQKSERNQERLAAAAQARQDLVAAREERAQAREAKAQEKASKAAEKAAAQPKTASKSTPKPVAKKTASAAKAAPKPAAGKRPVPRPRPKAAAAATDEGADF